MRTAIAILFACLALGTLYLNAQTTPPAGYTLITAQGRRPLPVVIVKGQEMVATDDLVVGLQVAVRDDASAGGLTFSYKGRTVVVSPDQAMASVGGRLVPLPSPAIRSGRRWLVPLDLLSRALAPIYDAKIEVRKPSRMVIVGDLRVPRVTVRLDSVGPPTRLSVEASPSTLMTPTIESGRVTLRLDADALDVAPLPQGGGLLDQARTEGSTVVLTLAARAGLARATQGAGDNLSRISLEVPAGSQDVATAPAQVPPAPSGNDGTPPALPGLGAVRVVVLDPGHGGTETGAVGESGIEEKTLALDIARYAKSLLETKLGIRVVLTREDDRQVSLDERTARANASQADLFISLHLNASLSPMTSGAEVYQLRPSTDTPPGGRRGAGADRPLTLPVAGGGSRTINLVPWNQAQARHREDSTLLANLLESALRGRIPMSDQPIREAPLRVLAGLDMAAAVVELAYLTNPDQARAAQSEDFQIKASQGIFDAVTAFRSAARGVAR